MPLTTEKFSFRFGAVPGSTCIPGATKRAWLSHGICRRELHLLKGRQTRQTEIILAGTTPIPLRGTRSNGGCGDGSNLRWNQDHALRPLKRPSRQRAGPKAVSRFEYECSCYLEAKTIAKYRHKIRLVWCPSISSSSPVPGHRLDETVWVPTGSAPMGGVLPS
jgi:hypothetical protein